MAVLTAALVAVRLALSREVVYPGTGASWAEKQLVLQRQVYGLAAWKQQSAAPVAEDMLGMSRYQFPWPWKSPEPLYFAGWLLPKHGIA